MDVQMPVMDGPDAALAIRAAGHRVPMLALTAGAGARERQRCESAGFDAVLAKPIARDALVESILRWAALPAATTGSAFARAPTAGPSEPRAH
jgi:CheY-like chemotaxis protein